MDSFTEVLAMVRYDSLWDWLLSRSAFNLLAGLGSVGAFAGVVVLAWRRFPLRGPYFTGLFVLGLCPFLLCTANALTDIHYRMGGDWSPAYISTYVTRDLEVALFGSLVSGLAIFVYSCLYAFSRKSSEI